jgi:ATP-dependent DNA helicase RecG
MGTHSRLQSPVQYLKGVGPRRAERFEKLGVRSGRDLLYHVPRRYEDATRLDRIGSLRPGDEATVIGEVVAKGVLPTRRRLRIFRAIVRDASGRIEVAWPGQPWLDRQISKGDLLLVTGSVGFFHGLQLRPREHTVLAREGEMPSGGRIFPVYAATEGLSHRQIRTIVEDNLDSLIEEVAEREVFPADWLDELRLPRLEVAMETLHRPTETAGLEGAVRRLAWEELFFLQLLHARARHEIRNRDPGHGMTAPPTLSVPFLEALPFRLTGAQERAWSEIRSDMEDGARMYRLLQGDVGSGKTVVAAAAMLKAVENGLQAAIMAPTELLAEQHLRTLTRVLAPVGEVPGLLTGSVAGGERTDVLTGLAEGSLALVVGTHALFQEGVSFARPGLMVIDEQHRFGVSQRRALRDLGGSADMLVMSATPIPRSLALTLYGDLDLSVIDEMPPGRQPVRTGVRSYADRDAALSWIRRELAEGRQAYFVYPLIEESEAVEATAVKDAVEELRDRFPEFVVESVHGRMPSARKDETMRRFAAGEISLLVATTVIEVGIDVPNATIMVIEHAERFGLSQLHQLRGRVGRGAVQSWCVAFHSADETPPRLRSFAASNDGFRLAREDLKLRGQGDLFGAQQHGAPELRFADLERDADLLEQARKKARAIVEGDPELSTRPHRALARELVDRYADREDLFAIG